jgi:hypothetical protein
MILFARSTPATPRRRLTGFEAFALGILMLAMIQPRACGDEGREPDREDRMKFPGRIYIEILDRVNPVQDLIRVDPNEGTIQKILSYSNMDHACVSPDAGRLVLSRNAPGDLDPGQWLYRTTGEKEFRITERRGRACWWPDGKTILVSEYAQGGRRATWRIDADGSHEERLPIPATETVFDVSSDGRWLLTEHRKLRDPEFSVIHPDGTGERPLDLSRLRSEVGARDWYNPRLSPDGRNVLLRYSIAEAIAPGGEDRRSRAKIRATGLFEIDTSGGPMRRLLEREVTSGHWYSFSGACWSPDGRAIAVGGVKAGQPEGTMFVELVDGDGNVLADHSLPGPLANGRMIDWR